LTSSYSLCISSCSAVVNGFFVLTIFGNFGIAGNSWRIGVSS
jgi:hypothetical protein